VNASEMTWRAAGTSVKAIDANDSHMHQPRNSEGSRVSTFEQGESDQEQSHGVETEDEHPGPRPELVELLTLRRDHVDADPVRQEFPQVEGDLVGQRLDDEWNDEEHADERADGARTPRGKNLLGRMDSPEKPTTIK